MKTLFAGWMVAALLGATSALAGETCCAGKATETTALPAGPAGGSCCGAKAMQPTALPAETAKPACCGQKQAAAVSTKTCGADKLAKREGARYARKGIKVGQKGGTYLAGL